ncbi:hypothetical protein Taro_050634 [Colocasia esculenta]|uniref:Retrotransposon gag domain-containing protein n=1 Tax=Colocasia esculenta TaxID=4460 RepID=A0A843XDY4_COLES|nr:hypothetical protein [Colocasia esculenta]
MAARSAFSASREDRLRRQETTLPTKVASHGRVIGPSPGSPTTSSDILRSSMTMSFLRYVNGISYRRPSLEYTTKWPFLAGAEVLQASESSAVAAPIAWKAILFLPAAAALSHVLAISASLLELIMLKRQIRGKDTEGQTSRGAEGSGGTPPGTVGSAEASAQRVVLRSTDEQPQRLPAAIAQQQHAQAQYTLLRPQFFHQQQQQQSHLRQDHLLQQQQTLPAQIPVQQQPSPAHDLEQQFDNQELPPVPPVAVINTPSNQPAHFYPQQVDPSTINKLMVEQLIDMKLAERGDGEQMAFDAYRVPYPAYHAVKRLPPGVTKPSKFDKFNGRGSPKEHIAYYINVMGDLAADESYLLKFFGSSLTSLAFEWYSSLPAGSISDWTDMQKKFRERFYIAEREVTVAELYATGQRNNESALDYIQRWRNLSMRCKRPPHQEDAVQICKQNLKRELLERMIGVEIRSFDRLNNIVAEIEAFLAKYPSNSSASQKSKPADKKPVGKEVHVVDLKTFEKQRDEGGTTAGAPNNKTEQKRKVIPFQDKMRKPYSFPKEKTKVLFDWGIRYNKVTLPTPKRPDQAAHKDDPRYCLYHQILGHPLEDCYVFKDIMEGLIKKGELQMGDYRIDPPQPHELPARQGAVNMISLYQQLPEEISEASTEKTYESHILTPIKEQEEWQKVPSKTKRRLEKKPTPKVHIRGVTPQPPAPVITPVWHPIGPRVVIQRNPGNRRRQMPLPLYRGGSPSIERLQALIDELDEYEQPERHPVQLEEYVPWEELEKLTLGAPVEQGMPQPQEDLFWGQETAKSNQKKKKRRPKKKKKAVATLSCNTISSLLGLTEQHQEEEFYFPSDDVNQIGASGAEFITRSGRKWGRSPPANQNIIFRGEPSYKIPEPEVQGVRIPPPTGLYTNEKTGGIVPSFTEFLAAEERAKTLSTAPTIQKKADDRHNSPIIEPQVKDDASDKEKLRLDDVRVKDRIIKLLKRIPTRFSVWEILSLSEETRKALISTQKARSLRRERAKRPPVPMNGSRHHHRESLSEGLHRQKQQMCSHVLPWTVGMNLLHKQKKRNRSLS